MKKLIVTGKSLLNGKVKISGSKNAGLPIIISTLLASGQSTISNVPNITDIQTILKLFNYLGVKSFLKDSNLIIDNSKIKNRKINSNITKNSRAIILILGPLLLHFGSANISLPGGCKIGYRPIDLHINSLKAIGSNIKINNYNINANVNSKGLKGTFIDLPIASVGATQHIMITATLIKGNTIINNAAKEPEVIELASALKKMGANISGEGSSYIQIVGVTSLNPLIYKLPADRIEIGTFIAAAAICGSTITLQDVPKNQLNTVLQIFKQTGCVFKWSTQKQINLLQVSGPKTLISTNIETEVYPGFPTDMQAQFMACMTLAYGQSYIKENIFKTRFHHAYELNKLGANITINNNKATINGVKALYGTKIIANDLRGSASLLIASLKANGTSTIYKIHHIDRGYCNLEQKFIKLGAKIKRL